MISHERLPLHWFEAGIFLDKARSSGGQGFRLKQHEKNPALPLSPVYFNFRLLRSYPDLACASAQQFVLMMEGAADDQSDDFRHYFHRVADVPTAATPLVTLVSQYTRIPMITPREAKGHGSGSTIDGVYEAGQRVALFDDLITSADSKLEAIRVLENASLKIAGVFVLLDREQGGALQLKKMGYKVHVAYTITQLLELYRFHERISPGLHEEILDYLFPTPADQAATPG